MSEKNNKHAVKFIIATAILVIAFLGYRTISKPLNELPKTSVIAVENTNDNKLQTLAEQEKKEEFKQDVEKIVKQYIADNPEIIISTLESFQKKRYEEHKFNIASKVKEKLSELSDPNVFPVYRTQNIDLKIFAFLDYNCIYCKKLNGSLKEVLNNNPKLSLVYNLYPVLGEGSVYVTKLMIAVNKLAPERFKDIHDDIMELKSVNRQGISDVLTSHGLQIQDIEKESSKDYVSSYLSKVSELAKYLEVSGVPIIVVGDQILPGFVESEVLQDLIKEQLNKK
ncbi:Putative thiol:disulfide interchange protein [Candidatus Phycorickettsia trachydisci]|uniref:Thiol:disulfide interchange protein n=1 Tax=Candidatus Phycorickettsia trachydisci TaxID=2115978 RepID=A0A2P1P787_9RICK|nr:thioredoxin domain-containing protein [Candidatus Phycorickettsia trachydisci]AVP87129.1 Putative thiol:disulfide interchange protein [Candidatus Phycorickettsia trachydisci]